MGEDVPVGTPRRQLDQCSQQQRGIAPGEHKVVPYPQRLGVTSESLEFTGLAMPALKLPSLVRASLRQQLGTLLREVRLAGERD